MNDQLKMPLLATERIDAAQIKPGRVIQAHEGGTIELTGLSAQIVSAARLFTRLDNELANGHDVFKQRDEAKTELTRLCAEMDK